MKKQPKEQKNVPTDDRDKPLLIIGLGNIGSNYELTRHNAGFLFTEFLREHWHLKPFSASVRCAAHVCEGVVHGRRTIVAQAATMMNNSGTAVISLMRCYEIPRQNILIIHDDTDIEIGRYKFAHDSRAAGQKGVEDIIRKLGTQQFNRVRIGVRPVLPPEAPKPKAGDLVLKRFNKKELQTLRGAFPEIARDITTEFFNLSVYDKFDYDF